MATKHVNSVSGSKDSTAELLLAVERCPPSNVVPIFCDTGNKHKAVYDYLAYLEKALGVTIHRLRADFIERFAVRHMFIARDCRTRRDRRGRKVRWTNRAKRRALAALHPSGNSLLDLCMLKGRFPSRKAQFCTEELKRDIAVEFQLGLQEQGHRVISWQGVRRDESEARRHAKLAVHRARPAGLSPSGGLDCHQCLCLRRRAEHSAKPALSAGRQPPRMHAMHQLPQRRAAADLRRWPEHLQRISDWEHLVGQCSKRGFSTFFTDAHSAPDRRQVFADLNVWSRIEWAKITRDGRQYDLPANLDEPTA